eukprot:gene2985-8621_t
MSAELEEVTDFSAPADHEWCLDLKQSDSDEVKEGVFISSEREFELEGSRGIANFMMKFPGSSKQVTVTVLNDLKDVLMPLTKEEGGAIDVPIAAFECRGCEPVKWTPTGGYTCKGAGSAEKTFEVDFEDDEWADYDDANDASVQITEITHRFVVHKVMTGGKKGKKSKKSLIPAIRDARCNNKAGLLASIVSDGAYLQLSEPSVELGAAVRVLTPFQPPSD